jgi:hypothetical protein
MSGQEVARLQGRESFTHQAAGAAVPKIAAGFNFWYNISEIVNSNVF